MARVVGQVVRLSGEVVRRGSLVLVWIRRQGRRHVIAQEGTKSPHALLGARRAVFHCSFRLARCCAEAAG